MENLLEFYIDNRDCYDKYMNFLEESDINKDSISSLSFIVLNTGINIIANNMNLLEDDDEFCYKCMYRKMDVGRKAITRYLTLETEVPADIAEILIECREKINEWCKFINLNYSKHDFANEHIYVKNSYHSMILEEMQQEEEEDDDDDDDFLSLN